MPRRADSLSIKAALSVGRHDSLSTTSDELLVPTHELQEQQQMAASTQGGSSDVELIVRASTQGSHTLAKDASRALVRASKKFVQMDVDGNEEQKEESAKLLRRLDEGGDGRMTFEEFSGWFERTCTSIEGFRSKGAQRTQGHSASHRERSLRLVELGLSLEESESCASRDGIDEALREACREKSKFGAVKYLVEECKADVNACEPVRKRTPLAWASSNQSTVDLMKYLVECKADVDFRDMWNETPLIKAIDGGSHGRLEKVKYLVEECKSDVNVRDKYEQTPLLHATMRGKWDIVKYLVEECKADVKATDEDNKTAIDYIIVNTKTPEIVKVVELIYEAAKAQTPPDKAQTPSEAVEDALSIKQLAVFREGTEWCKWASMLDATLGRYILEGPGPEYSSKTCTVFKAVDVLNNQKVALKIASKQAIEHEVRYRVNLDSSKVLPLFRFHVPKGRRNDYMGPLLMEDISDTNGSAGEDTESGRWYGVEVAVEPSEYDQYVLAMPWADATLSDELRKKQIAGFDVQAVAHIAKCVAESLKHMHQQNVIHGDVKPRNICKVDKNWAIIDLDTCREIRSQRVDVKYSEGYMASECMAHLLLHGNLDELVALVLHDIWSFGVLLFELTTGTDLFAKDIGQDNMISEADRQSAGFNRDRRLLLHVVGGQALVHWTGPSQQQLDLVFKNVCEGDFEKAHKILAKDLISICLQGSSGAYGGGCPWQQLTMADILKHPYFWKAADLGTEESKRGFIGKLANLSVDLHTGPTDALLSYQSEVHRIDEMETKHISILACLANEDFVLDTDNHSELLAHTITQLSGLDRRPDTLASARTSRSEVVQSPKMLLSGIRQNSETIAVVKQTLIAEFVKKSELTAKLQTDVAPRNMLLLPRYFKGQSAESWLDIVGDLLETPWSLKEFNLLLLCEGPFAGVSTGHTCTTREPFVLSVYQEWFVKAVPYLRYMSKLVNVASEVGLGVSGLGGKLHRLQYVLDVYDAGDIPVAGDQLETIIELIASNDAPEAASKEAVTVSELVNDAAKLPEYTKAVDQAYNELLGKLSSEHISQWIATGDCQGLLRVSLEHDRSETYWLCSECAEAYLDVPKKSDVNRSERPHLTDFFVNPKPAPAGFADQVIDGATDDPSAIRNSNRRLLMERLMSDQDRVPTAFEEEFTDMPDHEVDARNGNCCNIFSLDAGASDARGGRCCNIFSLT